MMQTIVTTVLIVLALAAFGALAHRTSSRNDGTREMRYPKVHVGVGVVSAAMFGFIAVASQTFWSNETATLGVLAVFVLFSLGGVLLTVDGLGTRHSLLDEGLLHRWPFRAETLLRWDEIDLIECSESMKWRVLSAGRVRRRISFLMSNQPLFAEAALARAPARAIDGEVRTRLEESAAGNPPRAF